MILVTNIGFQEEPMLQELIIENAPSLVKLHHFIGDLDVSVLFAPKLEYLGCTNNTRLVFGPSNDFQVTRVFVFGSI
jgi:hypothetical protein